ncbi:hypothetical protein VYU27_005506 [Nannochloropsis oceanica]
MISRFSLVAVAVAMAVALALLASPAAAAADASCPVSKARTNDDYCDDLVSGCDETETSACSFIKRTPTFQCNASVTGEPHLLPASRVGDTVCDCCDGSDEAPGVCPDACGALQEEYLDNAFQWFEDVMAGKASRDAAVVEARGIMAGWEAELETVEAAHVELQQLLRKLKDLKAKEERMEGWENFWWLREEAKRRGEVLEEEQAQQQPQEEQEEKCEEKAAAATTDESLVEEGDQDETTSDSSTSIPNATFDNDAAAAPLPASFTPARTVSVAFTEVGNQMGEVDNFEDRLLSATATDGTLSLSLRTYLKTVASSSSYFSSPAASSKAATSVWEPTEILELNLQAMGALVLGPFQAIFWMMSICKNELMDVLRINKHKTHHWSAADAAAAPATAVTTTAAVAFEKGGWVGAMKWVVDAIARGPYTAMALLRPETIPNAPERMEAALLRFAVEKVEGEVERKLGRMDELREALVETWYSAVKGDEGVFRTWKDKCFEKQDKDFAYKICPFKEVKQNYLLVGKWTGWIQRDDGIGSKDGAGPVMYFTEGQQCWNGPKRTALVQLWCGPEEAVVEVTEPSVCLYDFVMTTPLVCDEVVVKEAEERLRRMGVKLPGDDAWEGVEFREEGGGGRIEREEL